MATARRMGVTPGLVFDMSRSCWDPNVRANTERLCKYLQRDLSSLSDRQNARRSRTCSRFTDETQNPSEHLKLE